MGSKASTTLALFLAFNLISFTLGSTCPAVVDLSACLSLVGIPIINIGSSPCCACFSGLVDLDAAVCLCAYLKTLNLGVDLTATVTAIVSGCRGTFPSGYQCA